MSSAAERLASLTPAQRAALDARLRERLSGASAPSRIGRRADPASCELSFAQQRLWFVEQLQPSGAANHISAAVRLEGPLSIEALRATVADILARHEVLRTAYVDDSGRPVARLLPPGAPDVRVIDVPAGEPAARVRAARALVAAEAERAFDLSTGPLLRLSLVRLSHEDHVLVLVLHHIAADGWSMGVLARELSSLYGSHVSGAPATLEPLPVQYADYAAWQRTHVAGPRLEAQLAWWRQELQGLHPLELPADRPRPAAPSLAGTRASLALPRALSQALVGFSQRRGVTLFMTLLAAFDVLLSRWSGRLDLAVGTPVAGRTAPEIEGLIGLFVNTLVLRADLRGNPSFDALLQRVRDTVTAALGQQDAPFERIVDEAEVERTLSHAPLTPVVFALQNLPASLAIEGLRGGAFEFERTTSRFDVCLFVFQTGEGLAAAVEYRTDLFDAATMERVLRRYVRLLQAIVDDSTQRIGDLPVIDDDERQRVLVEWNDTGCPYPRDATIHDVVAKAVARDPAAVAVTCGSDALTYAQLEARSDAVGRALAGLGVRPGARVGLCVDRSLDLAAALLGILKAGGAYVALDPGYPPQRLEAMAADAGLSVVVTTAALEAAVASCAPQRLCLDRWTAPDESPWRDRPAVRADDLAYISFTSGSTGIPKGVEVTHRAVLRLLHGVDYVRLGPAETFLQLAPLAFDASTFEIWGPWLHGGRLVLYRDRVPEFDELRRVLADAHVTAMWLTASLYNAVIDADPAMLAGVSQLLIGGEALSVAHVRRGLEMLPQTTLVNGYGPTEATTFTCCHRIRRADAAEGQTSIPIGRPIANTRVYVLDASFEPVPIGVPGELFAAGDGVARGYASAPRLTAERFVPDPFGPEPGARLYRTGDLVRYRHDGTIEFLGRRDGQVKVRGYRIELGEIETALTTHPSVKAAAARVWVDRDQRKSIVGYVVRAEEARGDAPDLRAFLKERLPDYMVPSAIVPVPALPLTANGKIDRDALPEPETAPDAARTFVGPRNEVEEAVVAICGELLGLDRISVTDNFFDVGGHSLLATQFASRLGQAFDTNVSVRAVFEAATFAELADGIVQALLNE